MVDIVLLQTVSIVIASVGVFLAAIYYILQIRHQTKLRQMDLIMRLYSTFTSKEHTEARLTVIRLEYKDYDDFVKKYDVKGPVMTDLLMVGNYLNEVGMLLHRGFIDIESVDDLLGYRVANLWEKMKPLFEEWRKEVPQTAKWFEYLHNELKKRERAGVKNG